MKIDVDIEHTLQAIYPQITTLRDVLLCRQFVIGQSSVLRSRYDAMTNHVKPAGFNVDEREKNDREG